MYSYDIDELANSVSSHDIDSMIASSSSSSLQNDSDFECDHKELYER